MKSLVYVFIIALVVDTACGTIELHNDDKEKVVYFPVENEGELNFKVKCNESARLSIGKGYELHIRHKNLYLKEKHGKYDIYRHLQDINRYDDRYLLPLTQYRGFWLKWSEDGIFFGAENQSEPLLAHNHKLILSVNYIGINTSHSGSWIFDLKENNKENKLNGQINTQKFYLQEMLNLQAKILLDGPRKFYAMKEILPEYMKRVTLLQEQIMSVELSGDDDDNRNNYINDETYEKIQKLYLNIYDLIHNNNKVESLSNNTGSILTQ